MQSAAEHPETSQLRQCLGPDAQDQKIEQTLYLPRPSYTPKDLHTMQQVVQMFAAIRVYRDGISDLAAFEIVMDCKGINGVVLFG